MSLNTQEPWESTAKFQGLDLLSRKENLFLKRIKERGKGKTWVFFFPMFTIVSQHSYFCKIRVVEVCVFCVVISIEYMKHLGEKSFLVIIIGFYHK